MLLWVVGEEAEVVVVFFQDDRRARIWRGMRPKTEIFCNHRIDQ